MITKMEAYTMEIRERAKNIIYNALNYKFFLFEDFVIEEPGRYVCGLRILYDKYYFNIEYNDGDGKWLIRFSPGEILMEDSTVITMSEFERRIVGAIQYWLDLVKEDMLNPLEMRFIVNSIQEFKSEIDNKLNEMEDGYFTKEEGNILREKLEQIENMILNQTAQDEKETEILKMKEEIDFLKQSIDTLTKKKWLKNALVKMWSWGQKEENRKLIESSVEAVKAISQMDFPKL